METVTLNELAQLYAIESKHAKRVERRKREKARKAQKKNSVQNDHICMRGTEKLFNECKGIGVRKRVKNKFSTEEAGTIGSTTVTIRSKCSYNTQVCKARNVWY